MQQFVDAPSTELISEAIVLNNNLIPRAMEAESFSKTKITALKGAAIYLTIAFRLQRGENKLSDETDYKKLVEANDESVFCTKNNLWMKKYRIFSSEKNLLVGQGDSESEAWMDAYANSCISSSASI